MRLAYFSALLFALTVATANAEELTLQNHFISLDQGNGLMVTIPASGEQALLNRLAMYNSALNKQRSNYADRLENTKFDVKDALITIIMPGGLLYAAAIQQRHNQAKADLLNISNQLADLQDDMNQLSLITSVQTIALLN